MGAYLPLASHTRPSSQLGKGLPAAIFHPLQTSPSCAKGPLGRGRRFLPEDCCNAAYINAYLDEMTG